MNCWGKYKGKSLYNGKHTCFMHYYGLPILNFTGNRLAHLTLAEVKAMGWIFSIAALSPSLTQLTIHRREQIAAQ